MIWSDDYLERPRRIVYPDDRQESWFDKSKEERDSDIVKNLKRLQRLHEINNTPPIPNLEVK